jgi:hypothetical protein
MKSPRQNAYVPGVRNNYHGRHTLERIYRRIAASNVVGTLTSRVAKKSHGSRRSSQAGSRGARSAASSIHQDHPQGGVLQKRSHHLSQQRLERARSRRKARERQLQKVVENVDIISLDFPVMLGHRIIYYKSPIFLFLDRFGRTTSYPLDRKKC